MDAQGGKKAYSHHCRTQGPHNQALHLTASCVRSCVAPASGSRLALALDLGEMISAKEADMSTRYKASFVCYLLTGLVLAGFGVPCGGTHAVSCRGTRPIAGGNVSESAGHFRYAVSCCRHRHAIDRRGIRLFALHSVSTRRRVVALGDDRRGTLFRWVVDLFHARVQWKAKV
jgi:hypothetical protein